MKRLIKEQITKDQIKSNLKGSVNKIKNLIYLSNPEVFGLPEVYLSDFGADNKGLFMVLIGVKFEFDSEHEIDEFVYLLTNIKHKLTLIMNKISFDVNGELKPKTQSGYVTFSNTLLIDNLKFNRHEGIISLDIVFHSNDY